jgi:hypothetical protein
MLLAKLRCVTGMGAFVLCAACDDLPRDPEDTSGEVAGGVLRVGWIAGVEPSEIERAAIAEIAAGLEATVETAAGPVHRLIADLEDGKLHIVAGALPEKTPFAQQVGLTNPVGEVVLRGEAQPAVMAIRSGENRFLLLVNEAIERARR